MDKFATAPADLYGGDVKKGKAYPIISVDNGLFTFIDDSGEEMVCRFKGCGHLNGVDGDGDWEITDA